MISFGVALASHGEVRFNLYGFIAQAAAVAVCRIFLFARLDFHLHQLEASRLVMIQLLLHGLKMDPLVSLHYYAPVCALINLCVLPFTEGLEPFIKIAEGQVGVLVLLSNAAIAFLLNVAAVFLVGAGSGLILTLAGVFKDILLITSSVLIWGTIITPLQVIGECQALCQGVADPPEKGIRSHLLA
jgi:hypothetical protein